MIKINFDPKNPHNLTSNGAKITEDINVRTHWSPELGVLNEAGQLRVVIQFHNWITDVYTSKMSPPQINVDQFNNRKFRTFVDNAETEAGNVFAIIEQFVFEFSKAYIVENYGVNPELIEYLPM